MALAVDSYRWGSWLCNVDLGSGPKQWICTSRWRTPTRPMEKLHSPLVNHWNRTPTASKSSKRRFEVMPKTFWDGSSQLLLKSRPRHTRLATHHVGPAWEPQKTAERSRSAIFIYIRMPMSIHLYRQASVAWHWRESCRMDMGNAFVNRLRTSRPDA